MKRWIVLLFAAATATGSARTADWVMDAGSSRLTFAASFEGNPASGTFRRFDTRVRFDPARPADSRLDVVIDVREADMKSGEINKAIAGPAWFDVARFPRAEFHSTDITARAAGTWVARGVLQLKGVEQPVIVPFSWSESGDTARMDGDLVVKRSAFGIGTGEWAATNVIGSDVTIRFHVELRKAGG